MSSYSFIKKYVVKDNMPRVLKLMHIKHVSLNVTSPHIFRYRRRPMDNPKMDRSLKNFTLSAQLLARSGHKFGDLPIVPISCIRFTHNQ